MYHSIKKIFRYISAVFLILGGIIGLFIPIPGLFFLLVVGLYLLENQWINNKLKFFLGRFKKKPPSAFFVTQTTLPPAREGTLSGLKFGVQDVIDIQNHKTGAGNPTWGKLQPPAASHAIVIEQLLYQGAECLGKTVTDEFGFSLLGGNYFYGTPLNTKAPDRVPGGSASGSAAAVAGGVVDFALGRDTGGSVRVPANHCGVVGFRPTHGKLSVAGVDPFAPSFDTVGVVAKDHSTLSLVMSALLNQSIPKKTPSSRKLFFLEDAFDLIDPEVSEALTPIRQKLSGESVTFQKMGLGDFTFDRLLKIFCQIQFSEIWCSLGSWVEKHHAACGPWIWENFIHAKEASQLPLTPFLEDKAHFAHGLRGFLQDDFLLCIPTVPSLPPLKGSECINKTYYPRLLGLTSISGLSSLPQITLPLANWKGVPVGLSLIASRDIFLISATQDIV